MHTFQCGFIQSKFKPGQFFPDDTTEQTEDSIEKILFQLNKLWKTQGLFICSRIFELLLCARSSARCEGHSSEQVRQGSCSVKAGLLHLVTWGRRTDSCGLSPLLTSGLWNMILPFPSTSLPPCCPSLWSPSSRG